MRSTRAWPSRRRRSCGPAAGWRSRWGPAGGARAGGAGRGAPVRAEGAAGPARPVAGGHRTRGGRALARSPPRGTRPGVSSRTPRPTGSLARLVLVDKIRIVGGTAPRGHGPHLRGQERLAARRLRRAAHRRAASSCATCPRCATSAPWAGCSRALGAEVTFRVGGDGRGQGRRRSPRSRRPTTWSRPCAPRCSCSARCVARDGRARVSLPGGCAIGARPIDLHLQGPREDGRRRSRSTTATSRRRAKRCTGPTINFDTVTVTGTENLMMAAALAEGETVLRERRPRARDRRPGRAAHRPWARTSRAPAPPTIRIEGVDRAARRPSTPSSPTASRPAPSWPPRPSPAATSRSATATPSTCAR